MCACVHIYICIYVNVCMCVCECIHIYIYMCVCVYLETASEVETWFSQLIEYVPNGEFEQMITREGNL